MGIIGPNGAGKTTLFRMIPGNDDPDSGVLRMGDSVTLGYVDQSRDLAADKTVWEEIAEGEAEVDLGEEKSRVEPMLALLTSGVQTNKKSGAAVRRGT